MLFLKPTLDGGRKTALAGGSGPESRYQYRPNWGLPGMDPPDQTGALVLAFSRTNISPGESVRAVIIPPFPAVMDQWAEVQPGTRLPMYEGPNVVGVGKVLWVRECDLPLSPRDEATYRAWAEGPDDGPEPT